MKKQIDFDGYNVAEIEKIYIDGQAAASVYRVESAEDGSEVITKESHDLVFPAGYFDLTEEEIAELLTPIVEFDVIE